uniref:TNFR-Cys domain-containing protein n=1 Tax=Naja naja TaxID=35670 RepID=A0A8C6XP54_NAJNA
MITSKNVAVCALQVSGCIRSATTGSTRSASRAGKACSTESGVEPDGVSVARHHAKKGLWKKKGAPAPKTESAGVPPATSAARWSPGNATTASCTRSARWATECSKRDWNMQKLIAGKRKFTQSQEKAGDFGTKTAVGHTDFGFRFRNFAFPKKELDWMSWVFSSYTGGPPVHWKEPGTRETDVECAPCQPGTFSDHESHQNVCTPHRTCQSVLVPGNSTHNTVCGNPGRQVDPETTTTPQLTTTTKRLLWRLGTERPTFNQQHPLAQTGQIVGMTAIPVVLVALICFIVFRKSGQKCFLKWGEKKQPFLPAEKFPVQWSQEPTSVGQEKDSLLQMSPSGFWDSPAGGEKSSETNNGDPPKLEMDNIQQRSVSSKTCCSTADSAGIVGNGKAQVNVSCVVSICNSGHSLALKPSGMAETGRPPDPPLSQEETTTRIESGRAVAVEVEDTSDFLDPCVEKPLPFSVQDVGMKRS